MKVTFNDAARSVLEIVSPADIVEQVEAADPESVIGAHRRWIEADGEVEVRPQDALKTKRLLADPMVQLALMMTGDGVEEGFDALLATMDQVILDRLEQNDGDAERTVHELTPQSILDLIEQSEEFTVEDYVQRAAENLLKTQQHYVERSQA